MKTITMIIGFLFTVSLAGQASNAEPGVKNKTENVEISKTNPSSAKKTVKTKKAGKEIPHSTVKRSKI